MQEQDSESAQYMSEHVVDTTIILLGRQDGAGDRRNPRSGAGDGFGDGRGRSRHIVGASKLSASERQAIY